MTKKKEEKDIYDFDYEEKEGSAMSEELSKGVAEDAKEHKKAVKYRYFCDACTNIAFFSSEVKEGLSGVCHCCGKPYVTRKENYILI